MKRFWEKLQTSDIRNIIAVLYIVMVLAYVYVLAWKPVPEINKDLINVLGGTVIGGSGLILAFYFGASKSSTDKSKSNEDSH